MTDYVYDGLRGLSILLSFAGAITLNPGLALAGKIAGDAADAEATITPEVQTLIADFHGKVADGTVTADHADQIAKTVVQTFAPDQTVTIPGWN